MNNKKSIALVIVLAVMCIAFIGSFVYYTVETTKLKKDYLVEAQTDAESVRADAEYLNGLMDQSGK